MKRKSIFKRGGIFVLSAIMALTMCSASAFAASIGNGVATTTDTQITVPKGVTFINEDAVTSYGPGIEFTYTVGPATVADGSMTVTDSNGNTHREYRKEGYIRFHGQTEGGSLPVAGFVYIVDGERRVNYIRLGSKTNHKHSIPWFVIQDVQE